MKSSCSGKGLSDGFPVEFGDLLDYSRSLDFNQLPDYGMYRCLFASLAGETPDEKFDWTPCYPQTVKIVLDEPKVETPDEDKEEDHGEDLGEDICFRMDLDTWDLCQGERDKSLTLLAEQEAPDRDSCIPLIAEVLD